MQTTAQFSRPERTVRERRKALGLTQEQLAALARISLATVRRIEGGQVTRPHRVTGAAIEDVLDALEETARSPDGAA